MSNYKVRGKPFEKGNIPWHQGKKGLLVAWNKGKYFKEQANNRDKRRKEITNVL